MFLTVLSATERVFSYASISSLFSVIYGIIIRDINYTTNCARFAISTSADIPDLPTTTTEGVDGNGVKLAPVKPGSSAVTTSGELKMYMLDGATNEWKERVRS